jgi:hypothetical protein
MDKLEPIKGEVIDYKQKFIEQVRLSDELQEELRKCMRECASLRQSNQAYLDKILDYQKRNRINDNWFFKLWRTLGR